MLPKHTRSLKLRTRQMLAVLVAMVILTLGILTPLPVSALTSASAPFSLSAQAALLLDADSGAVLYEHNARTRLPMASTTKIMTALVVVENIDPSTSVCIDRRAVGIEGSSIYLYEGEWLTVEQLLMGLLLESANDAAVALAIAVSGSVEEFTVLMNRKAAALGLKDTHFENPHGLDATTHYTTAYDLGLIAAAALTHPILQRIMSTRRATIPLCDMRDPNMADTDDSLTVDEDTIPVGSRVLLNHNKMLRYYDGAIGVKTGYTKRSGRCLVSAAERDGLTLIAVTLNAPDDWNDHTTLLDYGFSRYTHVTLCSMGEYQTLLPVSGGKEGYVMVTNRLDAALTLPRDHGALTCRVELPRFLLAPVAAQSEIGRLIFLCDTDNNGTKEEIAAVPLHAMYDVEPLPAPTLLSRILTFFQTLFSSKA
ncbi:MAG: D-alanyl-D-alanine carboxypeptidase [Clostridia bacterium]|nr:D-alanyl-D-alanine carboxypeptidase [Clostridia bacterium]